jgi:ATP-dependent Clp endopeptidase proteolytic subunit ClpP
MQAGANWFRIMNLQHGPTRVDIYDEIAAYGVDAQDFVKELSAISGPVELHINSPGGNIFDGIAIYNGLKQHKDTISVVVDGLAASAASFIAMAASPGELTIADEASMMVHNGFGMCIGDADDMEEMAGLLRKQTDNIAGIYAKRTGLPAAHWQEMMSKETWFIGQEAVDAKLADKLLSDNELANRHRGPVNTQRHLTNQNVDETPWDGPAAMQEALHGDNPEAAFRSICAGETTLGQPDEAQHWALPHHKHQGGPPSRKGVSSALGYFDRTQHLSNPSAAKAHLEAHEKAMGADTGSEESQDHVADELAAMADALRKVDR